MLFHSGKIVATPGALALAERTASNIGQFGDHSQAALFLFNY